MVTWQSGEPICAWAGRTASEARRPALSPKLGDSQANLSKSTKVLTVTPQGRILGTTHPSKSRAQSLRTFVTGKLNQCFARKGPPRQHSPTAAVLARQSPSGWPGWAAVATFEPDCESTARGSCQPELEALGRLSPGTHSSHCGGPCRHLAGADGRAWPLSVQVQAIIPLDPNIFQKLDKILHTSRNMSRKIIYINRLSVAGRQNLRIYRGR